jgi:hypothetical protein
MPFSDMVLTFIGGSAALAFVGSVIEPILPGGDNVPWPARFAVIAFGLTLFCMAFAFVGEGFLNHLFVTVLSIVALVPAFVSWGRLCKKYAADDEETDADAA